MPGHSKGERAQLKEDRGNRGGKGQILSIRAPPPQVIDTVPLGEVAEDMFGYFEPLYQVIPDMPRPPESFLRRVTGQIPRMGALKVQVNCPRSRLRGLFSWGLGREVLGTEGPLDVPVRTPASALDGLGVWQCS